MASDQSKDAFDNAWKYGCVRCEERLLIYLRPDDRKRFAQNPREADLQQAELIGREFIAKIEAALPQNIFQLT